MPASLPFLLGLLDRDEPAHVAFEDFSGRHGPALRLWQRRGFLGREPGQHPVPGCPHCGRGVPYRLADRYRCGVCSSTVDARHLLLWRFDLEALLRWLARQLQLRGDVMRVGPCLWQLGSLRDGSATAECFFARGPQLSAAEGNRLRAYRNTLLLSSVPSEWPGEGFHGGRVSLTELLRIERRSLRLADVRALVRGAAAVRFDVYTGALWADANCLGEVPVGSKEYHFLACLWREADRFVAYADIKHHVLRHSGSTDSTEEATFCQRLKSRIKRKCVPAIDALVVTTNKGNGYRMRGFIEYRHGGTP
jgi:hypothetical protein